MSIVSDKIGRQILETDKYFLTLTTDRQNFDIFDGLIADDLHVVCAEKGLNRLQIVPELFFIIGIEVAIVIAGGQPLNLCSGESGSKFVLII